MGNRTIPAILALTDDPRQQLAMAFGSALEGGWSEPFPVGDQGTSFGPYQIHLPAHHDITEAQAIDPVTATSYMDKAYAAGVRAAGSLWSSDPEAAADKAAVTAERPAQDYLASRGKPTVDSAFSRALNAIPQTSAAAVVQDADSGGGGSIWGEIGKEAVDPGGIIGKAGHLAKKPFEAAGGAVADVIGGAFGAIWDDAKPFIVTMGFAGLGLALIGAGLVISTRGSKSSSTTTLPGLPMPAGRAGAAASAEELAPLALA